MKYVKQTLNFIKLIILRQNQLLNAHMVTSEVYLKQQKAGK